MTSKIVGSCVLTIVFLYLTVFDIKIVNEWVVALFAVYGTIMILPKSWSNVLKSTVNYMNKDISLKDVYSDTRTKDE